MSAGRPLWVPTSTYRLQLGPTLTLSDVEALVPYFAMLGVEALYLSPMLKARPGSTHGYDICDHASLNTDLGTEADLRRLATTATAHGLRLVADIVPNHMGVDPQANVWWREVLENGPCSPFAEYFDIDWDPVTPHLRMKVLLPILGDQYGKVLERGELTLEYDDGRLWLHYFDHVLPINPRGAPQVLQHAVPSLTQALGETHPAVIEFLSILEGLRNLPPYTDTNPDRIVVRQREKEVLRGRLVRLTEEAPIVTEAIAKAVAHVNGTPGVPSSFDELHALLEAQPYRLASWRTAVDEINYRRFFDVNELAGVRVEHEQVFQATHTLVSRWIGDGLVHGLRVDHTDGLFDPAAYFTRLQQLARDVTGRKDAFYVVIEKILSESETLRPDWEIHGTTGYEFLNDVNGLFVDPAGFRRLRRFYGRVTRQREPIDEIVYEAKRLIGNTSMSSELGVLADALARIARGDRHTRDFTHNSLRELITEYVACMPVYRTYVGPKGWTDEDARIVDRTIAEARRRNPAMEGSLFRFLRDVLLPEPLPDDAPASARQMREQRLSFAMKLQQYTGPVHAKGVEDTTFYRYNVLVSLNEVGGEPEHAVRSIEDMHARNLARAQQWPWSMTCLSTHDTKLSEDVRARINALSEVTEPWRDAVGRALRAASSARTLISGAYAPDRNDEYRFLQVLVGCWPPDLPMLAPAPDELVERMSAYMLKAIREAKRHTSWLTPNEAYEEATLQYVRQSLAGPMATRVLAALRPLAADVAMQGVCNALSQKVLELTSPGVPDTYQGSEQWKFDLVDPDNRRPVAFGTLADTLAEITAARQEPDFASQVAAWRDTWPDGRIKLHVVSSLLRARRQDPRLWLDGDYTPLTIDAAVDGSAIAYMRSAGEKVAIVVAGVRTASLPGPWPIGPAWGPSRVLLPSGHPIHDWKELLTGTIISPAETQSERWLFLAQALEVLPVAVFVPA